MKMVKSFSIRIVERNVSVIRARTSSNYREWKEYRPLWSSIFFFAMSTRLSVMPNFLLQISWLWATLDVVEVVVFHLPALVAIPRKRDFLRLAEETRNATDILLKGARVWFVEACSCLQIVCFLASAVWSMKKTSASVVGKESEFWVDLQWRIPIVRCSLLVVTVGLIVSSKSSEIPIINRIVYYAPAFTKQAARHSSTQLCFSTFHYILYLHYFPCRRRYYTH